MNATVHFWSYLAEFFLEIEMFQRKVVKQTNAHILLISGFHRALLQSITFISRLNALDYTKLRS